MINNISIMGRLTADPEISRTSNDNVPVCNFTIAVARPKRKDSMEEETDFFRCTAWRGKAEVMAKWFTKGDMVGIVGSLRNESYIDKNESKRIVTKILVKEVHFCGGKSSANDNEGKARSEFEGFADVPPEDIDGLIGLDDDLPF